MADELISGEVGLSYQGPRDYEPFNSDYSDREYTQIIVFEYQEVYYQYEAKFRESDGMSPYQVTFCKGFMEISDLEKPMFTLVEPVEVRTIIYKPIQWK